MMFAMVWMMMAFVMYLLRPQSLRGNRGDAKPQGKATCAMGGFKVVFHGFLAIEHISV